MTNKQLTTVFETLPDTHAQTARFSIEWLEGYQDKFAIQAMKLGKLFQYRLLECHDSHIIAGKWQESPLFDFNFTRWANDLGYVRANFYGDTLKLTRYLPSEVSQ